MQGQGFLEVSHVFLLALCPEVINLYPIQPLQETALNSLPCEAILSPALVSALDTCATRLDFLLYFAQLKPLLQHGDLLGVGGLELAEAPALRA